MRKRVVWQICLCAWVFSGTFTESVSAESSPALRALVERFLAEHPAAQAARADLQRAEAEARAFGSRSIIRNWSSSMRTRQIRPSRSV